MLYEITDKVLLPDSENNFKFRNGSVNLHFIDKIKMFVANKWFDVETDD